MRILNARHCNSLHHLRTFAYLIMQFLQFRGNIPLVVGLGGYPTHILPRNLLLNDILQPRERLIIGQLMMQIVQIEHIMPQIVMLIMIVLFQLNRTLLQTLPGLPTNKAQPLLIIINRLAVIPQTRKRINHNSRDDITEDEIHEHRVHHIE